VGNGTSETIVIGDEPTSDVPADTIYTGTGGETAASLASFINSSDLGVTAAATTASDGSTGLSITSGTTGSTGALAITSNISAAGSGVTASVVTTDGESSLYLISQNKVSTLNVTSTVSATTPTALTYTDTNPYSSTTADSGTLSGVAAAADELTGSVSVQVGSGTNETIVIGSVPTGGAAANTIYTGTTSETAATLATFITNANLGFSAAGTTSITLTSGTKGSTGALTVTSNLMDSTKSTTTSLGYTNSSDINNLSSLGLSVNSDGTLTYDATSLDSLLNTDYSGVLGFFQNSDSWGQKFSTVLTNSGSSSSNGVLTLASKSNSNIESTLNADISKEEASISAEQKSLTAELNSANEIMQEIPTQLDSVNELYSAVTGYNQSK